MSEGISWVGGDEVVCIRAGWTNLVLMGSSYFHTLQIVNNIFLLLMALVRQNNNSAQYCYLSTAVSSVCWGSYIIVYSTPCFNRPLFRNTVHPVLIDHSFADQLVSQCRWSIMQEVFSTDLTWLSNTAISSIILVKVKPVLSNQLWRSRNGLFEQVVFRAGALVMYYWWPETQPGDIKVK